jgi:hypothetical protein
MSGSFLFSLMIHQLQIWDSSVLKQGRTWGGVAEQNFLMQILQTVGSVASMYEWVSHDYVVHLD